MFKLYKIEGTGAESSGKNQKIGTNLTFEGEYVADFVERLDRVFEVAGVKMDGGALKILVGELKNAR